jgi:streptogramin lyase
MRLSARLTTPVLFMLLATSPHARPTAAQTIPFTGVSTFATGLTYASGLVCDDHGNLYVTRRTPLGYIQRCTPPSNTWTTFASGLGDPFAMAFDAAGNMYVTNYAYGATGAVYKITPGGVKTTLATLVAPSAIAVGPDGNIYVGLYNSADIVMITPAGVVSPYCDLTPYNTNARPRAFWFEPDGTLYVGLSYGEIVTVGPGGAPITHFNRSTYDLLGLAKLPDGNFYMTSYTYHDIWQIAPDGTGTKVAGVSGVAGHVDGMLSAARFNAPAGIAFCNGSMFVAEYGNSDIRVFDYVTPARTSTWGRIKTLYR